MANLDKNRIKLINFLSFLLGFGQAVFLYIISSFFEEASGTENVGVFYIVAYVFQLAILFYLHQVVSVVGKNRAFLLAVFFKIPILTSLVFFSLSPAGIVALMFYIVMSNIGWVILDMILESCSVDRLSGRIRGFQLTILNAGFICGPFISTYILERFNFQGVFSFMIVLYFFIFVIGLLGLRDFNYPIINRVSPFELLRKVWNRKNILRVYYISFALEFFYALMVIYTPIYLRNLGLAWSEIGIVFTIMLIPFVILQYPAGYLADRKIGEKEMIIFALLLTVASTTAVYFTNSASIVLWSLILFITRIGASLLEILRDSYFYKRINGQDIDLIDFFRTTRPAAYIVGAVISSFFMAFFTLKSVFILVAIVVFSAIIPAWKLVDNKSEREISGSPKIIS